LAAGATAFKDLGVAVPVGLVGKLFSGLSASLLTQHEVWRRDQPRSKLASRASEHRWIED
jgi:hypothetical protein